MTRRQTLVALRVAVVAVRMCPGREGSVGVSFRAWGQNVVLNSLDAWRMKTIYE